MPAQRKWSELSHGQQAAIVGVGVLEIVLTATAAVDLWRRPAQAVRGPKLLWAAALAIQPIGPIGYLTLGRRR
jgi:hypothetical protein